MPDFAACILPLIGGITLDRIRTILAAPARSGADKWVETRASMLGAELNVGMLEILTVVPCAVTLGQALSASEQHRKTASEPEIGFRYGQQSSCLNRTNCRRTRTFGIGSAATVIARRTMELSPDLTVVPLADGKIPVGEQNSEDGLALLRATDRPVLLVRTEPRGPYRRTLLLTEFDAGSLAAARLCLVITPGAHHTLFHALSTEDAAEPGREDNFVSLSRYRTGVLADRRIKKLAAALRGGDSQMSLVVQFGSPVERIAEFARRLGVDLVALGRSTYCEPGYPRVGATARKIIDALKCDLLVVPAESDEWDDGYAA